MITHEANLTEYSARRQAICTEFCTVTANAEEAFEIASKLACTKDAHDAAHNALKTQFRSANQTRRTALKALGPRPVVPTQPGF